MGPVVAGGSTAGAFVGTIVTVVVAGASAIAIVAGALTGELEVST
jgi:hypothetical protein